MRKYSSIAAEKTLSASLPATGTGSDTLSLDSVEGLPSIITGSGDTFTLVLSPDTVDEEIVTVTAVSGTNLTISRAEEGTSPAKPHPAGRIAKHMITARDLQEPQSHIASTEDVHGIADTAFLATLNGAQTLTNKTISGASNTISSIAQSSVTGLTSALSAKAPLESPTFTGTVTVPNGTITNAQLAGSIDWTKLAVSNTVTSTELGYVDGVTSSIQTQLNTLSSGKLDASATAVNSSKISGHTVFVQEAMPTANAIGDIWFQVTGL